LVGNGEAERMIRPSFIPPESRAPLFNLTTIDGIKRAIPLLAVSVVLGHQPYANVHDLLCRAYVMNCSVDDSDRRLRRIILRLGDLLSANVLRVDEIISDEEAEEWARSLDDEADMADVDPSL